MQMSRREDDPLPAMGQANDATALFADPVLSSGTESNAVVGVPA